MDSIIQWNTRGINSAKQDLLKLIEDNKPSAIAIQETFLGNDFIIKIPGYIGICKQGHYNQRFHGGVAIYIHASCPYETINIISDHQIIAAKITIRQNLTLTIASVYLPSREKATVQSLNNIIDQIPTPFILLGDFNGHNESWGIHPSDQRGRMMMQSINNKQLNLLNDKDQLMTQDHQ